MEARKQVASAEVIFSGADYRISRSVLLPSNTTAVIDGCCVKLADGKVVGFCGCRTVNGKIGVIGYNGVDPDYRGRGIARYLYETVFDSFRAQDIRYAQVFTGGENGHAPARRAYDKAGYDHKILNATYYKIL